MRALTLALLVFVGCVTMAKDPDFVVTLDMLSPAEQVRVRPLLRDAGNSVDNPDFKTLDQRWLAIVNQECKTSAYANCVCCQQRTARDCNFNNWDCCSSVEFAPKDGAACMIPNPCNCLSVVPPAP